MRKWEKILIFVFAVSVCIGIVLINVTDTPEIVINEVCTRNGSIGVDEESIGIDYIELYNTTDKMISLSGWYLSDDKKNPTKHCLPEIYIDPGTSMLFYATGESGKENEVNFKLSSSGEIIYLHNSAGKLVDEVYVPKLELDTAYARNQDGATEWSIKEPTPGVSNEKAAVIGKEVLNTPVFSHKSGYYDEEFVLTISAGLGEKIYYTTDGSKPTRDSECYPENGILIQNHTDSDSVIQNLQKLVPDWKDYKSVEEKSNKITVIRAIAMDKDNRISKTVTASYIVGQEEYRNAKIMSIVAEPEELYGEDGIFVTGQEYDEWYLSNEMSKNHTYDAGWTENYELSNFWKDGRSNEVIGNVQIFDEGQEILNQKTGIRVQGNYTRLQAHKNLQLISRKAYSGNRLFQTSIFEDYDRHALYVSAVPEKAHCLGFAEDRSLGTQRYVECPLFINGDYWYTAILMEKFDEEYFKDHYRIEPENILYMKDQEAVIGVEFKYLYKEMDDMVEDSTIASSDKIVMLYESIDVQNFIDWLCFNLYLCNNDVSIIKNCVMWRSIDTGDGLNEDGKWRWMLYDIDHCAVSGMMESTDFSDFSIISTNFYYRALKKYDKFCEQMILTVMDMMNTSFCAENVEKVLGRWGHDLSYGDEFFLKRPQYMIQSLRNEFGLTGSLEKVTVSINDPEAGKVLLNTIEPDLTNGLWTGEYFTDCTIKATAVPNKGYRFVKWNQAVDSTDNYVKVPVLEGGIHLEAVFEKE